MLRGWDAPRWGGVAGHQLEDGQQVRVVEGTAIDVGEELDARRPQLVDGAAGLLHGGVGIVERQGGDEPDEPVVPIDVVGQLVVADLGQLRGLVGSSKGLDRRRDHGQHLAIVVTELLHHLESSLDVEQHGHVAHPPAEVHNRRLQLVDLREVAGCEQVVYTSIFNIAHLTRSSSAGDATERDDTHLDATVVAPV